jgi:hypothetical protein
MFRRGVDLPQSLMQTRVTVRSHLLYGAFLVRAVRLHSTRCVSTLHGAFALYMVRFYSAWCVCTFWCARTPALVAIPCGRDIDPC